jgi:HEAT repeats
MISPVRPRDLDQPVGRLVRELADRLGEHATVEVCVDLLRGADRRDHLDALRYLTGHAFAAGDQSLDPTIWRDFWVRTWGARGLLYVWDDCATAPVIAGLRDGDWRPAEMCLKVATRREVGGSGDGAALLTRHHLPRVRGQALRTLGAVGDTEHVDAVREAIDDESPEVRRQAARALDRLAERLDLEA